MGAFANLSGRRLAREWGADSDAFVARVGREAVVREYPLPGSSTPAVAAPPCGTTGHRNVDHCESGAVSMEPQARMVEVAAASLSAAQQQIPAVTCYDSVDATSSVTSLRTLMAMPLASPV